jgi:hypothetical protein
MEDENNQKEIIIDNIIKKITNSIERKVKQLNSIETDLKEKKKTVFNEFNDVKDIKLSNDENELKLHNEKLVEEEKRIRIIIDNYNKNKIKVDEDINIYNLKENVPNLNTKKINLLCMEDTVFDYLQTIKKLLIKKVIKFEDGLKETRNISRELFNIKFLQIKLSNEEGKK